MNSQLLDPVPLWGIFLGTMALLLAALEAGYRAGRWRHAHIADEKVAPVGAMVGSVLGLLAIMLAFAFSLAASRFDARRQMVLEESNAIGTAYLRTRLLPEPERTTCQKLLREYVDTRIAAVANREIAEGLARSQQLQSELWSQATTAADKAPESIMTGLFIQSLNSVIDVHSKRVMAGLRSRMPLPIWCALFGLAAAGMISMGYQAGLSETRRSPAEMLLALSFTVVLFLIVDLDRAHEGLLTVGQGALLDLQKSMHTSSHP